MLCQPAEQGPENRTLSQAAADVTGIEENLHGQVGILGIGPQKAVCDLCIGLRAQGADGRKQVQAVRAGCAQGHRAVLRKSAIHCVLQKLQHELLLLSRFFRPSGPSKVLTGSNGNKARFFCRKRPGLCRNRTCSAILKRYLHNLCCACLFIPFFHLDSKHGCLFFTL